MKAELLTKLKHVLQGKLYLPRADSGIDRFTEVRRLQDSHRNREMRAIGDVERFHTENHELTIAHAEILDQCKVGLGDPARAEEIASDSPVRPDRGQQSHRIGIQRQFLPATVNDRQSVQCVNTIGEISVEIYVETAVNRKRLARLKGR